MDAEELTALVIKTVADVLRIWEIIAMALNLDYDLSEFIIQFALEKSRLVLWSLRTGLEFNNDMTLVTDRSRTLTLVNFLERPGARVLVQHGFEYVRDAVDQIYKLLQQWGAMQSPEKTGGIFAALANVKISSASHPKTFREYGLAKRFRDRLWAGRSRNTKKRSNESLRLSIEEANTLRENLEKLHRANDILDSDLSHANLESHEYVLSTILIEEHGIPGQLDEIALMEGLIDGSPLSSPQIIIQAAERLKSIRLNLPDAVNPDWSKNRTGKIRLEKVKRPIQAGRYKATLGDIQGFVECREQLSQTTAGLDRLKLIYNTLATIFENDSDEASRVLKIHGFIEIGLDSETPYIGMMYEYPESLGARELPTSLLELFAGQNSRPSLTHRFSIASKLALALWRLHTRLWLHQSFRSKNILFFKNLDGNIDYRYPYISGFEYARSVADATEARVSEIFDIYQHPNRATHTDENPVPFRREYDIFSFGWILFELGLWRSAEMSFPKMNISNWKKTMQSNRGFLEGATGDIYTSVIWWCLGLEDTSPIAAANPDPTDAPGELRTNRSAALLAAFYCNVLLKLESCTA